MPFLHVYMLLSYSTIVACECLWMQDLIRGCYQKQSSTKVDIFANLDFKSHGEYISAFFISTASRYIIPFYFVWLKCLSNRLQDLLFLSYAIINADNQSGY